MPGSGYSPEFDYNAAKPAGSDKGYDADNWLRSNLQHQDNFMAKEHYAPSQDPDESEDDYGSHYYVTLKELANKPSSVDSRTFVNRHAIYAKADGIYIEDEGGTEVLMLKFADHLIPNATLEYHTEIKKECYDYPSVPQDEIIVFDKDTAVTGYTLQTDKNDLLLFITKGSAAGGEAGGGEHSTGTWTQPDHTLIADEMPIHHHEPGSGTGFLVLGGGGYGSGGGSYGLATETTDKGGDGAHHHGDTWRPAARCMTRQKRN